MSEEEMMKSRGFAIAVLTALLCLPLAGCGSEQPALTGMDARLDKAVGESLLKSSEDSYFQAECSSEGHIIMGYDTSDSTVTAYVLTMSGQYAFQDGNLVKCSGTGVIPAVMTFTDKDGELAFTGIKYAEDGDRYAPSIREMFPQKYLNRALNSSSAGTQTLSTQERAYVEAYLKSIGRQAKVGNYGDFPHPLPDIPAQASNNLLMFEEEHGYPIWLGNQETVENGVRYVYEKSWDKSAGEVVYKKYEYGTGNVAEQFRFDDATGMQIKK
jgi:hypothetical protein